MTRKSNFTAGLLALGMAVALAACSDDAPEPSSDDNESAKGEILGGTISDDMLPLESVTSRSPQLADEPEPAPARAQPVETVSEAASGPAEAQPVPAPAPPAAPEAAPQTPAAPEEQL